MFFALLANISPDSGTHVSHFQYFGSQQSAITPKLWHRGGSCNPVAVGIADTEFFPHPVSRLTPQSSASQPLILGLLSSTKGLKVNHYLSQTQCRLSTLPTSPISSSLSKTFHTSSHSITVYKISIFMDNISPFAISLKRYLLFSNQKFYLLLYHLFFFLSCHLWKILLSISQNLFSSAEHFPLYQPFHTGAQRMRGEVLLPSCSTF